MTTVLQNHVANERLYDHNSLLLKKHDLNVCLIVAHPDDETLWAGGTILMHPEWNCFIFSLCRASDSDRAPKFRHALSCLGAFGTMADLDDSPEQKPLSMKEVQQTIERGIASPKFDLVVTHGPEGEYTRHRRHEQVSQAVFEMVESSKINCIELWQFAYEDGGRQYNPRAIPRASCTVSLPDNIWNQKYKIITEIYGFAPETWEARITPRIEAFNQVNISLSHSLG